MKQKTKSSCKIRRKTTKKANKNVSKRQRKTLQNKKKNTRKNKIKTGGGDVASVAIPVAAGVLGSALLYNILNKKNKSNKTNTNTNTNTNKNDSRKYQFTQSTIGVSSPEKNNSASDKTVFGGVPIDSQEDQIEGRAAARYKNQNQINEEQLHENTQRAISLSLEKANIKQQK